MTEAKAAEYRAIAKTGTRAQVKAMVEELLKIATARAKKAAFEPPTQEEVNAYAKEIGLNSGEPQAFYDHQEKIGWVVSVGKSTIPMSSWKAALRTWQRHAARFEQRDAALPSTGRIGKRFGVG